MSFTPLRRAHAAIAVATAIAIGVSVAVATGAQGSRAHANGPDAYTVGLFGDMPYNALGKAQYPAAKQIALASMGGPVTTVKEGAHA